MNEFKCILHYIYLLQSSLNCYSHKHPLSEDVVVYRSLETGGRRFATLYESMIDEVIVWLGFTSTSLDRDYVINHFMKDEDSILFEIILHPGDIAACIEDYSAVASESEILIAASTGFRVEGVEYADFEKTESDDWSTVTIPVVKLSYFLSWSDFNIDDSPHTILIGEV
jgi:hypothetical protein